MSSEHTEITDPSVASSGQPSDERPPATGGGEHGAPNETSRHEATVLVRGETVHEPAPKSENAPRKKISQTKSVMQDRLPVLDDDAVVGIQQEQIVIRDGKADLAFTGTLLAAVAPSSAPKGQWQEYRIYETTGGKHVFSKVTRSVFVEDLDSHEADVFDPAPTSKPSQLLRSARDLTRSRPLTWMDAAVDFFGYDPLAKTLYRKLSGQFEEHIS